jgi:hypothetical protein
VFEAAKGRIVAGHLTGEQENKMTQDRKKNRKN